MRYHIPLRAITVAFGCASIAGLSYLPVASATTRSAKVSTAPIVSKQRCATNRAAGQMSFVSPFLYDASAGIIDVIDAKLLGYFSQMCLNVSIVVPSSSLSPYQLVSAGRGTITGEGSAADTFLGTAHGANLVAITTLGDTSDYALLTRPSITNLKQLDGKLLGYHTQLPVVLSEMLKKAGANLSSIDEINDESFDPTVLFDQKPGYSALQGYQSNEPLTLEADGYKLNTAFRVWTPAQFGVQGTFNIQVVNGTFLKKHTSAVADFMRAELHALNFCLAHETTCVTLEQNAASAAGYSGSLSHALAEWKLEAALVREHTLPGKGIGVETSAEWTPEAKAVVAFGLVKSQPSLSRVENTSLVAGLYRGTSLQWPGN